MTKTEIFNPCDSGAGFLHAMMDGISPSDIAHTQNIEWVVGKYLLLSDAMRGELFKDDFLLSDKGFDLLYQYEIELENRLSLAGIEFLVLQGLTAEGQKRFQEMMQKEKAV